MTERPALSFRVERVQSVAMMVCAALALMDMSSAHAEEGGSGHYLPGSMASFVDGVAPKVSYLVRYNLINYEGSIGANRPLPIGGLTAANAATSVWGNGITFFWRPPFEISESGKWSFGISGTIPYISLTVSGDVATTLPSGSPGPARRVTDSASGIGDLVLMPVMLNYTVNPDFNINLRLAIYAPTGSYHTGDLANTGKNYWSFEPDIGLMYLGTKNGIEASWISGLTFNSTNTATDYKSHRSVATAVVAPHSATSNP
jgi:hypothetical protein